MSQDPISNDGPAPTRKVRFAPRRRVVLTVEELAGIMAACAQTGACEGSAYEVMKTGRRGHVVTKVDPKTVLEKIRKGLDPATRKWWCAYAARLTETRRVKVVRNADD